MFSSRTVISCTNLFPFCMFFSGLNRVEMSDAARKTFQCPKSSSPQCNETKTSTKFVENKAAEPRTAQPCPARGGRDAARDPQPWNARPRGCPSLWALPPAEHNPSTSPAASPGCRQTHRKRQLRPMAIC